MAGPAPPAVPHFPLFTLCVLAAVSPRLLALPGRGPEPTWCIASVRPSLSCRALCVARYAGLRRIHQQQGGTADCPAILALAPPGSGAEAIGWHRWDWPLPA